MRTKLNKLLGELQDILSLGGWMIQYICLDIPLPGCQAEVTTSKPDALIWFEKGASEKPDIVAHEMVHIFLRELGIAEDDLADEKEERLADRLAPLLLELVERRRGKPL